MAKRNRAVGPAWQVGLLELPIQVKGSELAGILLVAEEGTGIARHAAPVLVGESLAGAISGALDHPTDGEPGEPSAIRVRGARFAAEVRAALGDRRVPVEVVAELPEWDHIASALAAEFGFSDEPPSTGITTDHPRWAAALIRLCALAPWEQLGEDRPFRFSGDPVLDPAVAIVVRGEGVPGVMFFTSEEEYAAFARNTGQDRPDASFVQILDRDEVAEEVRDDARAHGLDLPGGRVPIVVGVLGEALVPLPEGAQRLALAAVQAIVAWCAAHLNSPGQGDAPRTPRDDGEPRELTALTVLGALTVRGGGPLRE